MLMYKLGLSCSMNMKMFNPQNNSINKVLLPITKWCQPGRRRWQNLLPKNEKDVQWLQLKVLPSSTNSSLSWRWPKPESRNAQQKEQLFAKGMMRWGRQELVATMGRALQLWCGCISILTAAGVMGQLLATCLCCKDSSWISCVATSGRILSIQKLQTSPYGCYTTNQGTYQCYFCCLMLTIPQQFCFCFIHNIKKDLKALHLWASLSWSLFRQTGQKMHVKQIRRNVWVHPTETDLFSKYKRGFLSLLAHTFWKCYTAGTLILSFFLAVVEGLRAAC